MSDQSDLGITKDEASYLEKEILPKWPHKTRKEKKEIKEKIIDRFLEGRGHKTDDGYARGFISNVRPRRATLSTSASPDIVGDSPLQKLTNWFNNNSEAAETRLPKAVKVEWTAREVFWIVEHERIAARAEELTQQGKLALVALNTARAEIWKALSEEEVEQFEETAELWTKEGPAEELLRELVDDDDELPDLVYL